MNALTLEMRRVFFNPPGCGKIKECSFFAEAYCPLVYLSFPWFLILLPAIVQYNLNPDICRVAYHYMRSSFHNIFPLP